MVGQDGYLSFRTRDRAIGQAELEKVVAATIDTYMMRSFHDWLQSPAARQYAASFTDPRTLARVKKTMEAEAERLRTALGIKRERLKTRRRGL
jgi:hypothetical protein